MKEWKPSPEAMKLLLDGQLALSEVEAAGVRVDKAHLESAAEAVQSRIASMSAEMADGKVARVWKKAYGDKTNFGSRDQLAEVMFNRLGHESAGQTTTGRERTDKTALDKLDSPFVRKYLKVEELKKGLTYLKGIRREMVEQDGCWYIHPSFSLNRACTFRSASSMPNWQNIPVRNPEMGEMIRRCYIPRKGRYFWDTDYSQIEVRVAACYNHDPALIRYIKDKSTDMHRDAACDIFMLGADEVSKECRHAAKNQFVFPQFYGSVYFQCAPALWEAITRRDLRVGEGGVSLARHLRKKGITSLGDCSPKAPTKSGTFVHHLKGVEEALWKRLKVYAEWKRSWYDKYLQAGGFHTFVGLAIHGTLSRNDVINYGVQSDAAMCLLKALVKLCRRLKKYKMKSLVVGEIHDSMQGDSPPSELQDSLDMAREIMTVEVPKEWPWIIVPLETESDVSPRGKSWFEKKEWTKQEGEWALK